MYQCTRPKAMPAENLKAMADLDILVCDPLEARVECILLRDSITMPAKLLS
jgi:hypothetical protein